MADENADVKSEITLDDFNADEQQPAKAESSPAPEAKAEDKTEAKDTKEEQTDDTATPPDVPTKTDTEDAEVDETETEDKPTKADERKDQLNKEIRGLVAEKNEYIQQRNVVKAEVEKANAEVYQAQTADELTEDGMNAIEAKVEAMRQEREMEKYNNQVAEAQLTIGHESQRVLQDFPQFNSDDPSYDKELADEASELLQANLIIDPNTNQVIGSNVSPYQLYKTLARASGISAVKGQIKGQADTEKQLANVDANTSAAPPKAKPDPLMDLWKSDD